MGAYGATCGATRPPAVEATGFGRVTVWLLRHRGSVRTGSSRRQIGAALRLTWPTVARPSIAPMTTSGQFGSPFQRNGDQIEGWTGALTAQVTSARGSSTSAAYGCCAGRSSYSMATCVGDDGVYVPHDTWCPSRSEDVGRYDCCLL